VVNLGCQTDWQARAKNASELMGKLSMIRVVALLTAAMLLSTAAKMISTDRTGAAPGLSLALAN
jgi:hypothetical protein